MRSGVTTPTSWKRKPNDIKIIEATKYTFLLFSSHKINIRIAESAKAALKRYPIDETQKTASEYPLIRRNITAPRPARILFRRIFLASKKKRTETIKCRANEAIW